MKLFSLFDKAINSALADGPSDAQTAKADEICKDVAGGDPKVFEYRFSGAQAKLFECTYDVAADSGTIERKTLVKLYNDPDAINFYRMNKNRLNDVVNAYQNGGDIGVGAEIYKTYNDGNPYGSLNFAIVQEFLNGGDLEDTTPTDDDIFAVARLLAKNHLVPYGDTGMNRDFCSQHWPWNTVAYGDHLNDDYFKDGRDFVQGYMQKNGIGDMKTLQEFYEYARDQAEMAPSPAVFSHGDPHLGNIFKLDDGTYRLLDYDNSNIGPRIWDLIYFWNKLPNTDKDSKFDAYINAYVTEYNAGNPPVPVTAAEISNEFFCHLPYSLLQLAAFYHTMEDLRFLKIDELTLYVMDLILKDKNFPQCQAASVPTGALYADCEFEAKSNDVQMKVTNKGGNGGSDAREYSLALGLLFLSIFR
ncbi:Oidioi.mRNA.OKI2018_I69.chr2.g6040.t1.cds [Oikopleura dioica]|uniref:Oidioi.mRNA.OKI2018_I69.chr2.g6040.t1.cds n=1 Tax=Oikopleura dioica TaxID=34765 RepID=A0ABN7T7V4_OIKDI|nr:Oidioi.mRNA.OKI2018_I69.chr2.g6040.t1.cds [Oikopleura dioica]